MDVAMPGCRCHLVPAVLSQQAFLSAALQAELLASLEAEDEQSAKKSGSAAVKAARKKAKKVRRCKAPYPFFPSAGHLSHKACCQARLCGKTSYRSCVRL